MKKLDKEQADYIVNILNAKAFDLHGVNSNTKSISKGFTHAAVVELIDDCVKKEFPAFDIETAGGHIFTSYDSDKFVDINDEHTFNHEEFKIFTAHCQEIVEWIKDEENE